MLARLAEHMFWGGRYLTRAEDTTRLIDVTFRTLLESPPEAAPSAWEQVLDVLHQTDRYREHHGLDAEEPVQPDGVLRWLVHERANPGSVVSSVGAARENARSVRELLSSEVWEAVNELHLTVQRRDLAAEVGDRPADLFRTVTTACQTVVGVAHETMPRDDAYRFLQIGRSLERAEMTCRFVQVRFERVGEDPTFEEWGAVLRSVSAMEAFRKRHGASTSPEDVVSFLILDETLPRSVLFSLVAAQNHLERLGAPSRSVRLLGRTRAALSYRDMDDLVDVGLVQILERITAQIREVTDAIIEEAFRHAPAGQMHAVGAP